MPRYDPQPWVPDARECGKWSLVARDSYRKLCQLVGTQIIRTRIVNALRLLTQARLTDRNRLTLWAGPKHAQYAERSDQCRDGEDQERLLQGQCLEQHSAQERSRRAREPAEARAPGNAGGPDRGRVKRRGESTKRIVAADEKQSGCRNRDRDCRLRAADPADRRDEEGENRIAHDEHAVIAVAVGQGPQ